MHTYGETVDDFTEGQRVELHPACDAWMMGDRFGTVENVGRVLVHVRMDRTERLRKVGPTLLRIVDTD